MCDEVQTGQKITKRGLVRESNPGPLASHVLIILDALSNGDLITGLTRRGVFWLAKTKMDLEKIVTS